MAYANQELYGAFIPRTAGLFATQGKSVDAASSAAHEGARFDALVKEAAAQPPVASSLPPEADGRPPTSQATAVDALASRQNVPGRAFMTDDQMTSGLGTLASASPSSPSSPPQTGTDADQRPWSFFDFLDVINPLQHIPIVSTLYRAITGDEIKSVTKIAGSTLFGGPVGAALAVADVAYTKTAGQGRDAGATMMAALRDDKAPAPAVMTASASQDFTVAAATTPETAGAASRSRFLRPDAGVTTVSSEPMRYDIASAHMILPAGSAPTKPDLLAAKTPAVSDTTRAATENKAAHAASATEGFRPVALHGDLVFPQDHDAPAAKTGRPSSPERIVVPSNVIPATDPVDIGERADIALRMMAGLDAYEKMQKQAQ